MTPPSSATLPTTSGARPENTTPTSSFALNTHTRSRTHSPSPPNVRQSRWFHSPAQPALPVAMGTAHASTFPNRIRLQPFTQGPRRQGAQLPPRPPLPAAQADQARTIPERRDQRAHRQRRGSFGGRPAGFDRVPSAERSRADDQCLQRIPCRCHTLRQAHLRLPARSLLQRSGRGSAHEPRCRRSVTVVKRAARLR